MKPTRPVDAAAHRGARRRGDLGGANRRVLQPAPAHLDPGARPADRGRGARPGSGATCGRASPGRRAARPAPPLFVARMVALAKASSQTAALLARDQRRVHDLPVGDGGRRRRRAADLVDASLSFGACLVLLAAALFLEYCCRVPGSPDSDDDGTAAAPAVALPPLTPPPPRADGLRLARWRGCGTRDGRLGPDGYPCRGVGQRKGAVRYSWRLELMSILLASRSGLSGPAAPGTALARALARAGHEVTAAAAVSERSKRRVREHFPGARLTDPASVLARRRPGAAHRARRRAAGPRRGAGGDRRAVRGAAGRARQRRARHPACSTRRRRRARCRSRCTR